VADIFQFDGTRFVQRPESLRQISVGNSRSVWGINDTSDIFTFNPDTRAFEQVPGKLELVRAGQTGEVWGINANSDIFQLNLRDRGRNQRCVGIEYVSASTALSGFPARRRKACRPGRRPSSKRPQSKWPGSFSSQRFQPKRRPP